VVRYYGQGVKMGGILDNLMKDGTEEEDTNEIVTPKSYGNGVFYFGCIREQFAKSLSAWLGKTTFNITALAPIISNGGMGCWIRGYLVIVETRAKPKQPQK
jgi:hypothetical protein